MSTLQPIQSEVAALLRELIEAGNVKQGDIVVIGTSTSEVIGERIGTGGASEVAELLYNGIEEVRRETGFFIAFQCCEHLNRALVIERKLLQLDRTLQEVSVVPVPKAGGAMAAYAYRHMEDPCVVEWIKAQAGIDIGDTLIGMHLRHVAVPFRSSVRSIGQAHVTAAYTRPKLIGGSRAVYDKQDQKSAEDQTSC